MSRPRRPQPTAILDRYSRRFRDLKREFQQLEYFCKGTLLKRMMKCGKAQCACRQDPAKRHGPYFEWTYKAKGKTVNVKLTPEVMPMFRAASQQYRKLKSLLNRLERLSQHRPAPSGQTGPIHPPRLIENRGYSHIPPPDPTRQRITSPELAHSVCVSRRPKVATPI